MACNYILDYLKRNNIPRTTDNYCRYNWDMTYTELENGEYPEWTAEVWRLLEDGELIDIRLNVKIEKLESEEESEE